jgi:acyl-CoA reductase-like NAD-dependent aldehyde dehydrogenase
VSLCHPCPMLIKKIPSPEINSKFNSLTSPHLEPDSPQSGPLRCVTMSLEVITTVSPTTGEPILKRNGASAQDLHEITTVATSSFESWRTTSLEHRQGIVQKALEVLASRKDELAMELTVQMGRPIAFTPGEISTAIKRAEYLVKISEEALADTDGDAEKGFKRFIRKAPVGPVLIIFAWNVSAITMEVQLEAYLTI